MLSDRTPETASQTFGAVERDAPIDVQRFSLREQSSGRGVPVESKFRSQGHVCNG